MPTNIVALITLSQEPVDHMPANWIMPEIRDVSYSAQTNSATIILGAEDNIVVTIRCTNVLFFKTSHLMDPGATIADVTCRTLTPYIPGRVR